MCLLYTSESVWLFDMKESKVSMLKDNIDKLTDEIDKMVKNALDDSEKRVLAVLIGERRMNVKELARLEGDLVSKSEKRIVHVEDDYRKLKDFVFSNLCPACHVKLLRAMGEDEGVGVIASTEQ